MQAHAARTGIPARPRAVTIYSQIFGPGFAAVLALEQAAGIHTGVKNAGFAGSSRANVPKILGREARIFGKADAAVGSLPGAATVLAAMNIAAKPGIVGGHKKRGIAVAGVGND